MSAARDASAPLPVYVLWPGADAVEAEEAAATLATARASAAARRAASPAALDALNLEERVRRCAFALVLPDGTCVPPKWISRLVCACLLARIILHANIALTRYPFCVRRWQQTREMWQRLRPRVCPPARLLCLPRGADGAPSPRPEALLLTEPAEGCLMTVEAVAHALAALEAQPPLLGAMMAPLRAVLALQRAHGMPAKGVRSSKRQMRLTGLGNITDDAAARSTDG